MADKTKALQATGTTFSLNVNQKVVPQTAPFAQQFRLLPCFYPNPDSLVMYFVEAVQDLRFVVSPTTPGNTALGVGFRYNLIN